MRASPTELPQAPAALPSTSRTAAEPTEAPPEESGVTGREEPHEAPPEDEDIGGAKAPPEAGTIAPPEAPPESDDGGDATPEERVPPGSRSMVADPTHAPQEASLEESMRPLQKSPQARIADTGGADQEQTRGPPHAEDHGGRGPRTRSSVVQFTVVTESITPISVGVDTASTTLEQLEAAVREQSCALQGCTHFVHAVSRRKVDSLDDLEPGQRYVFVAQVEATPRSLSVPSAK